MFSVTLDIYVSNENQYQRRRKEFKMGGGQTLMVFIKKMVFNKNKIADIVVSLVQK